jgi:hypothetical protein
MIKQKLLARIRALETTTLTTGAPPDIRLMFVSVSGRSSEYYLQNGRLVAMTASEKKSEIATDIHH